MTTTATTTSPYSTLSTANSSKMTSRLYESGADSVLSAVLASAYSQQESFSYSARQQDHQQQQQQQQPAAEASPSSCHEYEPPACLQRPQSLPHHQQNRRFHDSNQQQQQRRHPAMISPAQSPQEVLRASRSADLDFAPSSPLTAYSFKTMENEYNKNTWRMYERIQSARLKQSSAQLAAETTLSHGQLLSVVGEAISETRDWSYEEASESCAAFEDEDDAIFDFEL